MSDNKLAQEIIRILLRYQRPIQMHATCAHHNVSACFNLHLKKIIDFIKNNQPIEFVLPAFPAKSPNLNKTIGPRPDLGERLSLHFLNNVCNKVAALYSPGARLTICSDGHVFNDLVNVSDEDVNIYSHGIDEIIINDDLTYITTFGLDQCYPSNSHASMRSNLVSDFGEALSHIKFRIRLNLLEKMLFNGIHRFVYEDELSQSILSKNQIRILAKAKTYHIIQRSNAWSRLIEKNFPAAVRLSIHPQPCHSTKLGIKLLKSHDTWATPWHRIVLLNDNEHLLIRKCEAEKQGAKPVYINNQFSHYAL